MNAEKTGDAVHAAAKSFDHNRWTYVLVPVCAALFIGAFLIVSGCRPVTPSLADPARTVALPQFRAEVADARAEVAALYAAADARAKVLLERQAIAEQDVAEQQARRQKVLDALGGVVTVGMQAVQSGDLSLPGLFGAGLTGLMTGFGVGRNQDAKRKDAVIAATKSAPPEAPA